MSGEHNALKTAQISGPGELQNKLLANSPVEGWQTWLRRHWLC